MATAWLSTAALQLLSILWSCKLKKCCYTVSTDYISKECVGLRKENVPFPSPGDLPDPGIEPRSPAFQADALTSEPPGKPRACQVLGQIILCLLMGVISKS